MNSCQACGRPIVGRNKNAIYCSPQCCSSAYNKRHGLYRMYDSTRPTTGAINELLVETDLMKRGVGVFLALSPSCQCDLVALVDGKLLRVEVTTGYRGPRSGELSWPSKDKTRFEVLAVVERGGVITYMPEIKLELASHVGSALPV
jgi:hypothetical protein